MEGDGELDHNVELESPWRRDTIPERDQQKQKEADRKKHLLSSD